MLGTLEFAIHTLVKKRLDMSIFEDKYRNDETGRAAYDPKILLKIVLLSYSRGLVSSRKIEQACRGEVTVLASYHRARDLRKPLPDFSLAHPCQTVLGGGS